MVLLCPKGGEILEERMIDVINKKILAYSDKGMDVNKVSDGEHTFGELYEEINELKTKFPEESIEGK